jgi:hypothetical protein
MGAHLSSRHHAQVPGSSRRTGGGGQPVTWGAVSLQGCWNSDGSVSHNGVFNQGVTGAGQGSNLTRAIPQWRGRGGWYAGVTG